MTDPIQISILAALIFTVPGFIIGWASGLKAPWAAAASLPVSFGLFGFASWTLGALHIRYNVTSVLVCWGIAVVIALLWRLGYSLVTRRSTRTPDEVTEVTEELSDEKATGSTAIARPRTWRFWRDRSRRQGSLLDPRWIIPAIGVILGASILITKSLTAVLATPLKMNSIFQGWDVLWHANVIRFIEQEGVASSVRVPPEMQNIETGGAEYYPTGWHAGAYLLDGVLGLNPIEAVNYAITVSTGIALPMSVALLAWKILGNRGITAQLAAGFASLFIFGAPAVYWVGYYVGAWPYTAALTMTGIVITLFMTVPYRPIAAFAAAVATLGMAQAHPSMMTVLVLAIFLWWVTYLLFRPASQGGKFRSRVRDFGLLAATGIAAVVLFLPQVISGAGETDSVTAYSETEDISRAHSWGKAFAMDSRHVTEFFGSLNLWWVLGFAVFGAVVVLVWRRSIWAQAFYFMTIFLTVNALVPFGNVFGDLLAIIGDMHYAAPHRLVMPSVMLVWAFAGIGLAVAIRLVSLAPVKKFASISAMVSVVLAIPVGVGVYVYLDDQVDEGTFEATYQSRYPERMIDANDRRAFDWLAKQPHAYEGRIGGEPADGHGWMYAYNALRPLVSHYHWPDAEMNNSETWDVVWNTSKLARGVPGDPTARNNADRAVDDLKVNYLITSPPNFWAYQKPNTNLLEDLWDTPGVTQVYRDHQVTIWAINDHFTDAELRGMLAPGNSPEAVQEPTMIGGEPYFARPGDTPPSTNSDQTLVQSY